MNLQWEAIARIEREVQKLKADLKESELKKLGPRDTYFNGQVLKFQRANRGWAAIKVAPNNWHVTGLADSLTWSELWDFMDTYLYSAIKYQQILK